uniref:Uncharacterized protein n=1 Tax=Lepeophtheirus salmonis TaxID=72036 RepID=A0A0K2UWB7_LEPSM
MKLQTLNSDPLLQGLVFSLDSYFFDHLNNLEDITKADNKTITSVAVNIFRNILGSYFRGERLKVFITDRTSC